MATWHDIESARDEWGDDAPFNDDVLTELLEVSKLQIIAYAPTLPEPEDPEAEEVIPTNYRLGQLRQAQNLWTAGQVDSSGEIGDGSFAVRPHPLDWVIKQILRPRRGVPRVR